MSNCISYGCPGDRALIAALRKQLNESQKMFKELQTENLELKRIIQGLVSTIQHIKVLNQEEFKVLNNLYLPDSYRNILLNDNSTDVNVIKLKTECKPHPLLNNLVVENVMQRLSVNDLVVSRLVCKAWWEEANVQLRKKKRIPINYRNIETLSEFAELMEKSEDIPYSRFKFGLFVVSSHQIAVEQFFSLCGPVITQISLCFANQFSEISMQELRDLFLLTVPNLEILDVERLPLQLAKEEFIFPAGSRPQLLKLKQITIWENMTTERTESSYSAGFIRDLIGMAPNLSRYSVHSECQDIVTTSFENLKERKNTLEDLRLEYVSEYNVQFLTNLGFRLKMLRIEYFNNLVEPESVQALLFSLRKSLEKLHFSDYKVANPGDNMVVTFPRMERLRILKFRRPWHDRRLLFYPLSYRDQLPALVKLCFRHEEGDPPFCVHTYDDFIIPDATGACSTVKEFEVTHEFDSIVMLRRVPDTFPYLIKLKCTDPNNEIIRAIWEYLPNLEELCIRLQISNRNIDAVITGIPMEVCRQIGKENLHAKVDENVLAIIRTEPSVCNLKKLRKLVIEGHQLNRVTDISCSFAFVFLKTLTSLTITQAEISKESCKYLQDQLNLMYFSVSP